jgi:hypothetical protein
MQYTRDNRDRWNLQFPFDPYHITSSFLVTYSSNIFITLSFSFLCFLYWTFISQSVWVCLEALSSDTWSNPHCLRYVSELEWGTLQLKVCGIEKNRLLPVLGACRQLFGENFSVTTQQFTWGWDKCVCTWDEGVCRTMDVKSHEILASDRDEWSDLCSIILTLGKPSQVPTGRVVNLLVYLATLSIAQTISSNDDKYDKWIIISEVYESGAVVA